MSNTASILNLSGFASLREIAGIGGGEDFFTLRRQDAKREGGRSSKRGLTFAPGYSEAVREQRGLAGGSSKKGPAARDGGSYNKEER